MHLHEHRLGFNRVEGDCLSRWRRGGGTVPFRQRITAGGTNFGFGGNLFAAFRTGNQGHKQFTTPTQAEWGGAGESSTLLSMKGRPLLAAMCLGREVPRSVRN